MKTTYQIIEVTGDRKIVEIDFPEIPLYEDLKAILDPILDDWFEHVRLADGRSMFVDETGLLKRLQLNPVATQLYRKNRPHDSIIVGTAVVFDRNVWF